MTPQEKELVDELFDRLAKLETAPRDAEAERLIADGVQRAPHAVYVLVQTALLQDEALKRANARIEELQAQADGAEEPAPRPTGFLDSMRAAFAPREPRGSVPSVRAAAPGYQSKADDPPQAAPGYPPAPAFGSGGSFLGSAAATAAGMIGSSLLLGGIRSMFGHHPGDPGALGHLVRDRLAPHSGSAADSQLARDAGIDHIGDHAHGVADRHAETADESYEGAEEEDDSDDDFDGDDEDYADDDYDA